MNDTDFGPDGGRDGDGEDDSRGGAGSGAGAGAGDEQLAAGIRQSLDRVVDALTRAGARDEWHATFVAPRKVLLFTKAAALVPNGRVWRLGVFLLGHDGTLFATGATTRAVEPGRAGYQSNSAEERRGYRAAAMRGPFGKGETVNFDTAEIVVDADHLRSSTGPLFLADGRALVRWNSAADDSTAIDFDSYLSERVGFLLDPPSGA